MKLSKVICIVMIICIFGLCIIPNLCVNAAAANPDETAILKAPGVEWQKFVDNSKLDFIYDMQKTNDGGCILAGYAEIKANDKDATGKYYLCIAKLDSNWEMQWEICMSDTGYTSEAYSIRQTEDGGYIAAGSKSIPNSFNSDYLIVKLDDKGKVLWQRSYGGSKFDDAKSIQQTNDGGYIIAGETNSNDGDVKGNHGDMDYWIVKLDGNGAIEWQKCLGGMGRDYKPDILQTADGGYIIAGSANESYDIAGYCGYQDYFIVKLNNKGETEWQKCLGGEFSEIASGILETSDGGYTIVGLASSIWIVKLGV